MGVIDVINTPAARSGCYGDRTAHQLPAVTVSKVNDR
jgi:hypothetical protein